MPHDPSLDRVLEELRSADRPRLVLRPDPPDPEPGTVALVAGSFDPMTVAHAALAEAALERADLAALVYSVRTLPKDEAIADPLLSEADRITVLDRFCRSRTRTVVGLCSHGLLVDHVVAARKRFRKAHLLLVMGSDKVVQLLHPKWYEDRESALTRLFQEAQILYAVRAGEDEAVGEALAGLHDLQWRTRFTRLDVPPTLAAISSRLVRESLRRGDDVAALVPAEARPFLAGRA